MLSFPVWVLRLELWLHAFATVFTVEYLFHSWFYIGQPFTVAQVALNSDAFVLASAVLGVWACTTNPVLLCSDVNLSCDVATWRVGKVCTSEDHSIRGSNSSLGRGRTFSPCPSIG